MKSISSSVAAKARFSHLLLIVLFLGSCTSWAVTGGSISGSVNDQSGAAIPGASLSLINNAQQTPYRTVSDKQGLYSFPNLPVGHYTLTIAANGFATQRKPNLAVDSDSAIRVDVTLQIASQADTVTVTSEGGAQVDTVAQATTDSISALKSFAHGEEKHIQGQEYAAIPDYKLAVDLDPNFALAYARLGAIYLNAGEIGASSQYIRKAFALRNRTTDLERLYITAHYYDSVTGELDKLNDAYELWHSVYPRDPSPLNNLAWTHLELGDASAALHYAQQAVLLDPSSNLFDATLAMSYFRAGDYDSGSSFAAPRRTRSRLSSSFTKRAIWPPWSRTISPSRTANCNGPPAIQRKPAS